jgi:LPXTG-motif cell wall-anchored protein
MTMKVTRLIALLVAAFFVLLAPTAAFAAPYPGPTGGVVATPPSPPDGNGCSTTSVTVTGAPGDTLTLIFKDSNGNEVFNESQTAGTDGSATFTVQLCGPGTFTGTGTNQGGDVLGTVQVTVPGGGSQGGGAAGGGGTAGSGSGSAGSGSGSGNLPATGADSGTMLTLAGALALLLVGGVTLVAAKRKAL